MRIFCMGMGHFSRFFINFAIAYNILRAEDREMKAEKILFVTQEINPYMPESDLTKMGRGLPVGAIEQGREIRAFMPKWGNINERRNQLHEVIRLSGMNLIVNDTDHQLIIKVASVTGTRMQVYFIDNEDFFGKRLIECDKEGHEYKDNMARAVFYARGVLETVAKKLRWAPHIIHCQGWISAIVPLYLKTAYAEDPSFRDCRVVYSMTSNTLSLPSGDNFSDILSFRNAGADCLNGFGKSLTPIDLQKLAIKYSDGVTISAPYPDEDVIKYAKKIKKPIFDARDKESTDYTTFFDSIWSEGKETYEE